jgi:TolB protein
MTDRQSMAISDERLREALTWLPDDESVSADLASIVATVTSTPQRRWRLTGSVRAWSPAVRVAFLVLVLVSLAIAIGVVVGSQRRLPPPFGLARPGLIAFDLSGDIYVANPDGSGRTQLTAGPEGDSQATWSPNGTQIAYLSTQADLSSSLTVMGADGRHPTVLADHLAEPGNISWSPDSRRLAISARKLGAPGDMYHVYVAEVDHPDAIQLGTPELYGQDPRWSPDGTKIAFKRKFPCCGGGTPDGLWLMDPDGSHLSPLSTATSDPGDTFWNTAWSPDSRRLAFLADGVNSAYDVFVVNADGSGERNISNSPENEYWPSWSPDGGRIAFTRMTVTLWTGGELIVTDPGGSNPVVMHSLLVNSNAPVWSPDARLVLAYAKNSDESHNANDALAIFDPTGRTPPILVPASGFTSASWQRLAP